MTPKNALDHVAVGVPDLISARARLVSLGFQVQADAHHPFGTGNCNVFFENGTYFEPLGITDRDAELQALKEANPFVNRFDAFRFRHGYGPIMAAFTTDSAERMDALFKREGISGDILSFTRKQDMPDGSETTIGVHLAITSDQRAPDVTLFCCEHLSRDTLWQPERLSHPNGVLGISRLIAVETNPSDFQYLFQLVTGDRELRTTSVGLEMDLPNALVSVLSPLAYESLTGETLELWGRGPRLFAAELKVSDPGSFKRHLEDNDISCTERGTALIVPGTEAFNTTLVVQQA